MFEVGDRVIYKPIDYRDHSQATGDRWYGAAATIVGTAPLDRWVIAFDGFPECNHREQKNRFCADAEELEKSNAEII